MECLGKGPKESDRLGVVVGVSGQGSCPYEEWWVGCARSGQRPRGDLQRVFPATCPPGGSPFYLLQQDAATPGAERPARSTSP